MRKSLATVVLSSLVIAVVAFSVFAASPQAAEDPKAADEAKTAKHVQKWEYSWSEGNLRSMDERGKEGWEAFAATITDNGYKEIWYKRPKVESKKAGD